MVYAIQVNWEFVGGLLSFGRLLGALVRVFLVEKAQNTRYPGKRAPMESAASSWLRWILLNLVGLYIRLENQPAVNRPDEACLRSKALTQGEYTGIFLIRDSEAIRWS